MLAEYDDKCSKIDPAICRDALMHFDN